MRNPLEKTVAESDGCRDAFLVIDVKKTQEKVNSLLSDKTRRRAFSRCCSLP